MLIGYTRIATVQPEEDLDIQKRLLINFGCAVENIYSEKTANGKPQPELILAINALRRGDKFIIDHICRLGYDLLETGKILEKIEEKSVKIVVLDVGGNLMDSSTKLGFAMFKAIQAVAMLPLDDIREKKLEVLFKSRKNYKSGVKF